MAASWNTLIIRVFEITCIVLVFVYTIRVSSRVVRTVVRTVVRIVTIIGEWVDHRTEGYNRFGFRSR